MNKIYCILLIVFVWGCQSKKEEFDDKVLRFAQNDKQINEKEYEILCNMIKKSEEEVFDRFKLLNKSVNNSILIEYLKKLCESKNIKISDNNFDWLIKDDGKDIDFNINIYLENTASMDGYVGENSAFKNTVLKLIADLTDIKQVEQNIDFNYINTKIINIENYSNNDFYKQLSASDFKKNGGSRGHTDIEEMMNMTLDKINEKNLSIYISDCIFSPNGRNTKDYLDGQYTSIYNSFINAKKKYPNLCVVILQCSSGFKGIYYDYLNEKHSIVANRPYYIWLFGTSSQIKKIVDNNIFGRIKSGYLNKLLIQDINIEQSPTYKILFAKKIGDFDSSDGVITNAKTSVVSNKIQNKGEFGFSLAVDFSNGLQDLKYYKDKLNYELSDKNYSLDVEEITNKNDPVYSGFTHILKLKTNKLSEGIIKISIVGKTPEWVNQSTSLDDTKIEVEDFEKQKTFGLKYLVEAVCDAFYPTDSNIVTSISIAIRK